MHRTGTLILGWFFVAVGLGALSPGRELVVGPGPGTFATIQAAVDAAGPGDTVRVTAGVYRQAVVVRSSGTPGRPVVLRGEGAVLDGTGLEAEALVLVAASHVVVEGFELCNLSGRDRTVVGVLARGSGSGLVVRGNRVHGIAALGAEGNAHALAVYGDTRQGWKDVTVADNEVWDCRLGSSEAVVLNGNVAGFRVSGNHIHHVDNIGIDIIGGEGTAPVDDQARDGMIEGNWVHHVSSVTNPAYHGERSAGGIYVDGGASVTIVDNRVEDCDIGIELASENPGWFTEDIVVRGNTVVGSYQGNLQMGGYDRERGGARRLVFEANTTGGSRTAEVLVQERVSQVTLRRNTFAAEASVPVFIRVGSPVVAWDERDNTVRGGPPGTQRLD